MKQNFMRTIRTALATSFLIVCSLQAVSCRPTDPNATKEEKKSDEQRPRTRSGEVVGDQSISSDSTLTSCNITQLLVPAVKEYEEFPELKI